MTKDIQGSAETHRDPSHLLRIGALAALADQMLRDGQLDSGDCGDLTVECMTLLRLVAMALNAPDTDCEKSVRALADYACEQGAEIMIPTAETEGIQSLFDRHKFAEMCQPPGETDLSLTDDGLCFDVAGGERSRLWVKFPAREDYWLHLLVKPSLFPGIEPVVALRYLHDNDSEEVGVRLRRGSLVLHKEIDLPLSTDRCFLLSIGILDSYIHIYLNGIPVYRRPSRHPLATGFMLDVIGIPNGSTKLLIPLLAVQPAYQNCLGATPADMELLATGFVEQARRSGSKSRLHETLHALAASPLCYQADDIGDIIHEVRSAEGPFSDVLEDLLLTRLDAISQAQLHASRPQPIISVRGVSIELPSNPAGKNIQDIFRTGTRQKVAVLDGVSFDAFSGDIVGIIGRNGAGKTTFLKSLVGAIPISAGCIHLQERPILLRPGAGMQPDLTGRQNIYKTGLYMDMSMSEINAMIDDVIRFAELEDHIDRPFKYYSDGMRSRLIFSMATAMPRDILLLDELLSAGDMGFQERAMGRLNRFLSHAKLVFVVQHSFDFVLTRCTKCLLLDKGRPIYFGEPRIATELYRELL